MKLQSWGMRGRKYLVGAHEGWENREGLKGEGGCVSCDYFRTRRGIVKIKKRGAKGRIYLLRAVSSNEPYELSRFQWDLS